MIGHEHLGHKAGEPESSRVDENGTADHQPQRLGHRREIGRDVDRVGDDQQCDQRVKHRRGSCRARLRASPRRVCQPMLALMIWIAAMNGSVRNMVQQSAKPNCAPACE